MKVLVSADRAGLTIARSLFKSGVDFVCVGYKGSTYNFAFYSKFVKNKRLISQHPFTHPNTFAQQLLRLIKIENVDLIFPLGDHEDHVIINHLDEITDFADLAYDPTCRRVTLDKKETLEIAEKLGISIPKTVSLPDFKFKESDLSYPLVVKPRHPYKHPWIHSKLIVSKEQMKTFLKRNISGEDFLVQEYIPGKGYGFFALYNNNKRKIAHFMHERVHESLGWGGISTLARSHHDERLKLFGERLLESLGYRGVAMVEFRKDLRSNAFVLMEINGRYWGTLSLAIAAGVDFPALHCMYWNKDIGSPVTGSHTAFYQWFLGGETAWLRTIIKNRKLKLPGYSSPPLLSAMRDVIAFNASTVRKAHDVFQLTDMGPALYRMKTFLICYLPKTSRLNFGPKGFSWVIEGKLAASAKPHSRFDVIWLKWRGIKAILSLTEDPLPQEWLRSKEGKRFDYLHLSMVDHGPPSVEKLHQACTFIEEKISQRKPVLVHCLGGYGRTGAVLACFLMSQKHIKPKEAIRMVREIRPSSIEEQQEKSIENYYLFLNGHCYPNMLH
ncbi:MAG: dual specificity protein phosphatase family protein [Candidatus Bathyarchaeia archaeon]